MCIWIPAFLFISMSKILDPVIMLILYPVVVIPLYYFYKKFEKQEKERSKLI